MIKKLNCRLFFKQHHLAILSGILIGTSYIPFYPWALFFCFVPLWLQLIRDPQPGKVFKAAWLTQFLLTLIGFHWVAHTAHEFGLLPWTAAIPILIAFCSFANLHIPLAAWIWSRIHARWPHSPQFAALLLGLLIVLGEIYFPMIFPWHHGYAWIWARWPGMQWAELIGMQGLSAVSLFLNVVCFQIWMVRREPTQRTRWITALVSFLLLFNLSGHVLGQRWAPTAADVQNKSFHSIQANIGNIVKHFAQQGSDKATQFITQEYRQLTAQALQNDPNVDFIIWPETAFPDYLDDLFRFRKHPARLRKYVARQGIPLITGSYSRNTATKKTYNAVFFVEKNGQIQLPPYRKSILLAFGEYFPGAKTFPWLKDLVPTISDFGSGHGPQVRDFNSVKFGTQICYEGLYPEFSRDLARAGAEIFINVTNDSWFGRLFEPHQHLYMTFGRVLENRRPLLRNTNTGYSTAMLADGTILEMSPLHQKWSARFDMKYRKNADLTLFTRYGHWLGRFFLVLLALLLLWLMGHDRKLRSD